MSLKKYKSVFFFWKKQKGSTLLSTLISVALLGISSAGLFQYMQNFQSTTDETVKRINVDPLLRVMVINNMRSLLVEKTMMSDGSKATQSRYGICSLLHQPRLSHGVENLKISFQNKTSFSLPRWKVFFPLSEWKHVSASHCKKIDKGFSDGDFSRCFKYVKKTEQSSDIVYVIAEIVPRKFPSLQKVDLHSSDTYDPKQLVFQLKTAVSIFSFKEDEVSDQGQDPNDPDRRGKSTSYVSYQSDIVWANAVGECHIQARDGNWTVVSLSATGLGSDFKNRVVNNLIYTDDTCEKITLFDINDDVVQAGSVNDLAISSVVPLNARVACTKNKFSCRQKVKTEALDPDTYDPLQFSFNILNESYSFVPIKRFNVTLEKSDNTEVDGNNDGELDSVDISFYYNDAQSIVYKGNTDIDYNIPRGSGNIEVVAEHSNVLASYCHDICQNYNVKDSSTFVYPALNIYEQKVDNQGCEFSRDYSSSGKNRVQCIVCHTKSCHRYGLGTFGPLENEIRTIKVQNMPPTQKTVYGMSDEPLDGQVPECVIENSYETNGVRELPANVSGSGDNTVSGCTAMAMRVNSTDSFKNLNTNAYDATSCNTPLPVLCFTNGHYLPALKVNTSNLNAPYEVVVVPFEEAEEACFNIGREIGSYRDLAILLAYAYRAEYGNYYAERSLLTIGQLPSLLDGSLPSFADFNTLIDGDDSVKFNFINNASRGLFLAPSSYSLSYFRLTEKIRNTIIVALNAYNKIWTAMEWDAEGLVVASPPWALKAKDESLALFSDKRKEKGHRLVLLKDTNNYNTDSRYFALTYNLRWKGLVPQSAGTVLPFICKNNTTDRFFITTGRGVLSAGVAKCNLEGGLFVPPESGLDWSKLMLDLNPNDDHYPFPDPALKASDVVSNSFLHRKSLSSPKAWVAIQKITGTQVADKIGPRAHELQLYTGHFSTSSVFLEDTKNDMISAIFDAERFTDSNLRNKYTADPVAVITTSGLIPNSGGNAFLRRGFRLISEAFNLDAIDVDNAPSTPHLSLSGYKKVCVDKSERNEYIPVNIQDLGSSCPSGSVTMDISPTNSVQFKPTSYKYMSYWLKNIGLSDTDYITLTGGKLEQKVRQYNDKIDRLVACGNSCNSDHDECKRNCPDCKTETYQGTCTGMRPIYSGGVKIGEEPYDYSCEQTRDNCDDRDACYSTCDSERSSCRNSCS